MITGSVILGKSLAGMIVWTPDPGMWKVIVSRPGFAFAKVIASRNEPAPESAVVVTSNVVAATNPILKTKIVAAVSTKLKSRRMWLNPRWRSIDTIAEW